jgi:hypothetical protein
MKFYAAIPANYVTRHLPEGRYLVSAAGYWKKDTTRFYKHKAETFVAGHFQRPTYIPDRDYFVDCGAYSFKDTVLPWTFEQYAEFASWWRPSCVAMQDVPGCPFLTLEMLELQLQSIAQFKREGHLYGDLNWLPVIQGTSPREYATNFLEIETVLTAMRFNRSVFAIGNLKKAKFLPLILDALMQVNSKKRSFHLFGCSLKQLKQAVSTPEFKLESIDTGSWNGRFSSGIDVFNAIMKERNMTQRQVALEVYLPKYIGKVNTLLKFNTGCQYGEEPFQLT